MVDDKVVCIYCEKATVKEGHQCLCPVCGSTRKDRKVWLKSAKTGLKHWACSRKCADEMTQTGYCVPIWKEVSDEVKE